jgi:HAMP domain-containing protein
MKPLIDLIRKSLSLKVSLTLAVVLLVLTGLAATYITVHQTETMEEMTISKMQVAAKIGAQTYGSTLDQAIDSGAISINDVFDRNYQEIRGFDWAGKPKYHTKYDFFTDQAVLVFQDKFLDTEDVLFAVGADTNGYVPTHNTKFQKPMTGDATADSVGNRTKRIFNDKVGLTAALNMEPGLRQVYVRDTGETMWDVSAPIFVKGKHWGGFRLGVSIDQIEKRKRALFSSLLVVFGVFAAASLAMIFIMIRRAMKPVERLTTTADKISVGEGLNEPIKSQTIDEIGRLTKSLDRLRASMKAAMSRLGE